LVYSGWQFLKRNKRNPQDTMVDIIHLVSF